MGLAGRGLALHQVDDLFTFLRTQLRRVVTHSSRFNTGRRDALKINRRLLKGRLQALMQLDQGRWQANVVAQQLGIEPGGTTNLAQVGNTAAQVNAVGWGRSRCQQFRDCLLYTSPSPRDGATSRMPSSA